jgi:ADP-ribose pyrophosphatase YjhB (NUDIX family)
VWQLRAKYCPLCGAALVLALIEGRDRQQCEDCAFVLYRNPACASAGVVLDDQRRVLLIRRRILPFAGQWALPAGYQEVDEDPRATVLREIYEETGIHAEVESLFDVIFVPDDPRKPANVAVFLCRPVGGVLKPGSDAAEAAWFGLDALPEDLAFQNAELILDRIPRD